MLIDSDGEKKGIVSIEEALDFAKAASLDLVQVSPSDAKPVVCKILDYGDEYREIINRYTLLNMDIIDSLTARMDPKGDQLNFFHPYLGATWLTALARVPCHQPLDGFDRSHP